MARNRSPVLKTCRALDISPALLGIFKESNRGQQQKGMAPRRKKMSEYALQLREKQRVRFVYGVMEKQFYLTFQRALKMKGLTGENLLILLESRLDNVVYRLNLADTRRQAQQIASHGLVCVNGRRVDIPSYRVKPGDVITVRDQARSSALFAGVKENTRSTPAWLTFDKERMTGRMERMPLREEVDLPVNESLIVEYYSK